MNSTTLSIVSRLHMLTNLEWGIVSDNKSDIILEGEVAKKSDPSAEYVPFLHKESLGVTSSKEAVEYIKVNALTSDLSKSLPNTNIKICKSHVITPHDIMDSSEEEGDKK